MFAQVVPAVRTPHGIEGFDYIIPADLPIEVGSLVVVPFRRRFLPALVTRLSPDSLFSEKAKPISALYGSLVFPRSTLDLLRWTATHTLCSQPTVLKAWMRDLPKRRPAHTQTIDLRQRSPHSLIEAHWEAFCETRLVQRAHEFSRQKRVLILTPWRTRAERYAVSLGVPLLDSHQATGTAFQIWYQFLQQTNGCLVATRIGAWLASCVDIVLLDEPENDDHKQDELQPRYDARRIASWCGRYGGTKVESFGRTPPLHVDQPAPSIELPLHIHPRHPQGKSPIPCIQTDSLIALQEHAGPRVIVHPIRGLMARLQCRDCHWQAICPHCSFPLSAEEGRSRCRRCAKTSPLPLACPHCAGTQLNKSIPGIERLKQAWQSHLSDLSVEWRDLTSEQLDAPFASDSLVLITQPQFLGYGPEDLRRKERQCILLRRLAARLAETHGRLIMQSEEIDTPPWSSWLSTEGIRQLHEEERSTRRLFSYPPSVRRIKLILNSDETAAEGWKKNQATLLPGASWEGPFPVPYRRKGQTPRTIWHLIVPPETSEHMLIQALEPLANEVLIDLDPIAFFT